LGVFVAAGQRIDLEASKIKLRTSIDLKLDLNCEVFGIQYLVLVKFNLDRDCGCLASERVVCGVDGETRVVQIKDKG